MIPRKWKIQARIKVRIDGDMIDTTVGRVILSEVLPGSMPFSHVNQLMTKKGTGRN